MGSEGQVVISSRMKCAAITALAGGTLIWPQMLAAQVAPTEVNEQAVDEFGVDRKTGRFSWSTGEVIGVGGEGSRVSVAVTGVRTPPVAETFMPAHSYPVTINRPRLTIAPYPASQPIFPGEVNPNKNYVTVDYSGGSYTFECDPIGCARQYLHWYDLVPQGTGYLFLDNQGLEIEFTPSTSITTSPDGTTSSVLANGSIVDNFGFLLKFDGVNIQAVNLAVDYCDPSSSNACSTVSANRTASLPGSFTNPLSISDAAGNVTKLRWEERTAKESRPPAGQETTNIGNSIRNLVSRYPLGITLPGSTSEDITLTYNSINPLADTHDDIRVTSVMRNGVTATYQYSQHWPFGKAVEYIEPPSEGAGESNELSGVVVTGRLESAALSGYCEDMNDPTCNVGGSGIGGGIQIPEIETQEAPPDDDNPLDGSPAGSQIYELTIQSTVNGELHSESFALKPFSSKGFSRRRLLWTRDGLGRETKLWTNEFEEVAGQTSPEGNGIYNYNDVRGNVIKTSVSPKTVSSQVNFETNYTYALSCTATTRATCNKPLTVTDPKGNVTDYTYNDRGQVLTETKPAPTPGAARPTVVNEYTMRTAYIRDASGNPVAAGPPISILTKSFTCISSITCNASTPAADKVVTEYDYGPTTGLNNLLLRGVAVTAANEQGQIETLRTCYGYNYFGEKISETQPKAGLAVCP